MLLLVILLFAYFNAPLVSAQEDFIVTVGQNKGFTEYSYRNSWFEDDPDNPEHWPPIGTCTDGNNDLEFREAVANYPISGDMVGYPDDFTFVEVPDPLSGDNPTYPLVAMNEPNVGESFKDHHFKTVLTRVTQTGKIRHEYSRFDPFNRDQSMIFLCNIEIGDFMVYRTDSMPYAQNANLVRTISNLEENRWDPEDPNIL